MVFLGFQILHCQAILSLSSWLIKNKVLIGLPVLAALSTVENLDHLGLNTARTLSDPQAL